MVQLPHPHCMILIILSRAISTSLNCFILDTHNYWLALSAILHQWWISMVQLPHPQSVIHDYTYQWYIYMSPTAILTVYAWSSWLYLCSPEIYKHYWIVLAYFYIIHTTTEWHYRLDQYKMLECLNLYYSIISTWPFILDIINDISDGH